MAEQHVKIMQGLGIDEDTIKAIEGLTPDQMKNWKEDDAEALKIFNPADLVTKVQTGMKNVLSNDAAFLASIPEDKIDPKILKKLESGQYARFQNELEEVAIKKLGLDATDLSAEDKKSIKGFVEKIATTYLTKKGNVEGLKKMQDELIQARQENETLKTASAETLTKELQKANGANTAKLIRTLTRVELNDLDVDLAVSSSIITDPVLSALGSKYTVILDDQDNLVLKQKENPALDAIDGKGEKITFQQAAKEVVLSQKLGVAKKEGGDSDKKKKVIVKPGSGDGGGDGGTEVVADYIKDKMKLDE